MIIILLGPQGTGKSTQCRMLAGHYHLQHLSSGDCLRHQCQNRTELGKKAQTYMDRGQLVPDDLIVTMMMKEIHKVDDGADIVLDGFPRTLGQAHELDRLLEQAGRKIDAVFNLQVDEDELKLRITGRRICPKCDAAYHVVYNKPRKEGICDFDAQALIRRTDDTPEVNNNRTRVYLERTAPLVEHYLQKGILHHLDGDGNADIERVNESMRRIINRRNFGNNVRIPGASKAVRTEQVSE